MKVFRPGGLELTQKAAEAVNIKGRVLDIGCGLGTSLEYLQSEFGIVPMGIDASEETVRRADKPYIICADACSLPFENEAFDAVMLECVLNMIADPQTALSEAARVLKPGGALVISTLSVQQGDRIIDSGRVCLNILKQILEKSVFYNITVSDETKSLRQFAASLIFEFGSVEEYAEKARDELGSCVLNCGVPAKGTGYSLVTAIKGGRS